MDLERFDIVSLIDLDFEVEKLRPGRLEELKRFAGKEGRMMELLSTSYDWLFYREGSGPADNAQGRCPTLHGYERMDVSGLGSGAARGVFLLVAPGFGVGVLGVWRTFERSADPLREKQNIDDAGILDGLHRILPIRSQERCYPLVAIRASADPSELANYCKTQAVELGRVFTGGLEHESDERLSQYIVSGNISTRGVEQLFMRWTDALAVYSNCGIDEADYEGLLFRSAQVYETCIIARRLGMTLITRMDRAWWPWPNRLLETAAAIRKEMQVALPVQSDEARALLKTSYRCFGMDDVWGALDESRKALETRSQWRKAQLFGVIGLAAYLLDKLKVFDALAKALGLK